MKYIPVVFVLILISLMLLTGCSQTSSPTTDSKIPPPVKSPKDNLTVTFIDVGQGSSELIEFQSGKSMLINSGDSNSYQKVISVLNKKNIKQLDYVIALDSSDDMIGGMPYVLSNIPVRSFYYNPYIANTSAYSTMLDMVTYNNIPSLPLKYNNMIRVDPFSNVECIDITKYVGSNPASDNTILLKIGYLKTRFIFARNTGISLERVAGTSIIGIPDYEQSVDTIQTMLKEQPGIFVVEGALKNPLDSYWVLERGGLKIYFTARNGDVTVTTNGKNISVSTER